jgi:hypothetical protein
LDLSSKTSHATAKSATTIHIHIPGAMDVGSVPAYPLLDIHPPLCHQEPTNHYNDDDNNRTNHHIKRPVTVITATTATTTTTTASATLP